MSYRSSIVAYHSYTHESYAHVKKNEPKHTNYSPLLLAIFIHFLRGDTSSSTEGDTSVRPCHLSLSFVFVNASSASERRATCMDSFSASRRRSIYFFSSSSPCLHSHMPVSLGKVTNSCHTDPSWDLLVTDLRLHYPPCHYLQTRKIASSSMPFISRFAYVLRHRRLCPLCFCFS